MDDSTLQWLLASDPWVTYNTHLKFLNQEPSSPEVLEARASMLAHPHIRALLEEVQSWPGAPVKRHNDATLLLHKLVFLADLGLDRTVPELLEVGEKILASQSPEGPFQVLVDLPKRFGGSGEPQLAWMLCDSPLLLYALSKIGFGDKPELRRAFDHLTCLAQEVGWYCVVSPLLGKFRGPGRKTDPCPYATLVSVRALSQQGSYSQPVQQALEVGAEALLSFWEHRSERKWYLFGVGSTFQKLKAPLIWFDILHVLDVLTELPWTHSDPRLLEMAEVVEGQMGSDGRCKAGSVWQAWKGWSFGQKRTPSPWLTYLTWKVLNRMGR